MYILQAHDTLYGVSRRFGVPVKTLYEINGLAPDSALRIGQKILLRMGPVNEHRLKSKLAELRKELTAPADRPASAASAPASAR